MSFWNPRKEFSVSYPLDSVRSAIHKLTESEPKTYFLQADIKVFNQITLHQKGALLDRGYLIDFVLSKLNESETKVVIEISRPTSIIKTAHEMSVSTHSMKVLTDKFAAMLEGRENLTLVRTPSSQGKLKKATFMLLSIFAFLN